MKKTIRLIKQYFKNIVDYLAKESLKQQPTIMDNIKKGRRYV
jgi:hypothetical protein